MPSEVPMPARAMETRKFLVEAPAAKSEFPIRGHHVPLYKNLLLSLVINPHVSMERIVAGFISAQIEGIRERSREKKGNYRESHGRAKDDATLPFSYEDDIMGNDPDAYALRLRKLYGEFLGSPNRTPVTIGPVIDKLCQSCFFHQGNGGGLHCQTMLMPGEDADIYATRGTLNTFLRNLDRPLVPFYPAFVDAQEVTVSAPLTPKAYTNRGRNTAEQFTVPLGLVRDALVYDITRERFMEGQSDDIFYSYEQLLQSRLDAQSR